MPSFEIRDEQFEMMKKTYESMLNDQKIAIHAPTGTGKSLGYLIPFLAVKLDKPDFKMTISTFTISLQEQLKNELKMINSLYQDILGKENKINYTVLKGKNNYICNLKANDSHKFLPKKLAETIQNKLESDDILDLDRQNANLGTTYEQWSKISVDSCKQEACPLRHECSYYQKYFNQSHDIVILNHSLFFNRLHFVEDAWDDYAFNVFDEAHKLEKVIMDTYTIDFSLDKIESWVTHGITIAYKHNFDTDTLDEWYERSFRENNLIEKFKMGESSLKKRTNQSTISFKKLKLGKENFLKMVEAFIEWQKDMVHDFKDTFGLGFDKDNLTETEEEIKEDVESWLMNLLEIKEFRNLAKKEDSILWVEQNKKGVKFNTTPSSIKSIDNGFDKGTLLTSGTLAERGSCQSIANRLNVTIDSELVLPSPFDLEGRTLIYVGKDVSPKRSNYEKMLETEILELVKLGDLKTFILFTSKELMERMYTLLKPQIETLDKKERKSLEVHLQKDDNNKSILDSFKNKNNGSILFGTLTYFEGIDLKKDQLTQVILTRLPFSAPNHPIQELLDEEYDYSRWEAMVRFEQAFGRLIRTRQDYGSFCILDNRIVRFKEFLKPFRKVGVNVTVNKDDLRTFYDNFR